MSALQDKEFAAFGIVNNALKAGLLLGLLSLSLVANIFSVIFIVQNQGKMYEKMLERADDAVKDRVDEKMAVPLERLKNTNNTLDTVIAATAETNKVVDSAGKQILINNMK